jgi:uncharacterized protein YkwD
MVWKAAGGRRRGLAVVGVIAVGLAASGWAMSARSAVGDCTPVSSWGTLEPAQVESDLIALVNAHRAALGLRQLTVAPSLTASAEWKSMDMSGYDYMQHDDPAPVARTVTDRLAACGYPSDAAGWGENIAYGFPDAKSVMAAWLSDAPHRENLENPSWTTIGVGAAANGGGIIYWTEDFGTTGGSVPQSQPQPQPQSTTPAQAPAQPPAQPQSQHQSQSQPQGTPSPSEAPPAGPDVQAEIPETYSAAPAEGAGATGSSGDATVGNILAHDEETRHLRLRD